MLTFNAKAPPRTPPENLSVFSNVMPTTWVFLCIVTGIHSGQPPAPFQFLGTLEVAQVNLPVAMLIWLMIVPMLLKIDFGALHQVRDHWRRVGLTLLVNWAVNPFAMALLCWIFIRGLFADWLPAEQTPVALNDTLVIFAFARIVGLLLDLSAIGVPWGHTLSLRRSLHPHSRHSRPVLAAIVTDLGRARQARAYDRQPPPPLPGSTAYDVCPPVRIPG